MKNKLKATLIFLPILLIICCDSMAQQYQKIFNGVKVQADSMTLAIQFYDKGIVRVTKTPHRDDFKQKSFAVVMKPEKVDFSVEKGVNGLIINDKKIRLKIDSKTGQLQFLNAYGKVLLSENGTRFSPCKDTLAHAFAVKQYFKLIPGEAIYGLGQHQSGVINKRGRTILLEQQNMQIAIPYFYSTKGYGLYWDNTSATTFKDDTGAASYGTYFESAVGEGVNYYFLESGSMVKGLAAWRSLTGQAPMFPKWAYGYWQSREHYASQGQLLDVVQKYRKLKIPLDVIVQDWQYWSKDNKDWNAMDFGNPEYPRPRDMIDSVHLLHGHIAISVWPDVGVNTAIYKEMESKGFLYDSMISYPPTPNIKVYDAFNPEARDIYWQYMNRGLFSLGIDCWWLDATEPEQKYPDKNNDIKTYAGLFGVVRNAYPLETVGGVYNHQRMEASKKRVVILTRSAFAGQQRDGSINWSGDIQSSWESLRVQIANGLSMSVCGIPYWNSDIGGFFSQPHYPKGVSDPAFRELYVRWLEFGAFCPIMRSHGTNTPREIYQFGKKGDWAYDAIAKFIKLRYRLLPYIYSLAWQVTSDAATFMQPLIMDFPEDTHTVNISHEYLFGHAFLVSPVTQSFYTSKANEETRTDFAKVQTWPVYLPKGCDWYNFWTDEKISGGKEVQCKAPIDEIPLFVKAGSIIPLGPVMQYATQIPDSVLEIRIYPGADGNFILYEDENNNYDYENGVYSTIRFEWNDKSKILTIDSRKGDFPGMLRSRIFKVVLIKKGISNATNKLVYYEGKKLSVRF